MIYVEQKYYDSGATSARIVPENEAQKAGYYDGYVDSNRICDIYVDGFETMAEAVKCIENTKNA